MQVYYALQPAILIQYWEIKDFSILQELEGFFNVHVSSPLGQGGATALMLEVPALNRYTDGSLVYFGVFGVLALGVTYLFRSVKRQNSRKLDQGGLG